MVKKITTIITLLLTYLIICNKIYLKFNIVEKEAPKEYKKINTSQSINTVQKTNVQKEINNIPQKDDSIGTLVIEKINLNQKLYSLNSNKNNIEKNVTILEYSEKPNINNSIMFIAAHSGTGKKAFFKDLNKLKINDKIILKYEDTTYTYKIKDIWEIEKTGNINVQKENYTQLILTTCSPTKDNYQLIINSIQIK